MVECIDPQKVDDIINLCNKLPNYVDAIIVRVCSSIPNSYYLVKVRCERGD